MLDPVPAKIVAEALGVSGNQIYMWHQRRHRNGFPPAIAHVHIPFAPGLNRRAPLYDLDAVIAWHNNYDVKRQLSRTYRRTPRAALPLHRTEAGWPRCSTCDGGGCPDCTDPA